MEMTAIVNRRRMRHAHMVNINRQIMLEGMRADFNRVDALSSKVMAIVSQAKEITGKTAAGCHFTGVLNPDYRWLKTSGIISRDKWGQPAGRRDIYLAGQRTRYLRRGWCSWRLSL